MTSDGFPYADNLPGNFAYQGPDPRDAEIARLQADLAAMERRARAYEAGSGDLQSQRDKLRSLLEWMDRKGGLGLDVHNRITEALGKPSI